MISCPAARHRLRDVGARQLTFGRRLYTLQAAENRSRASSAAAAPIYFVLAEYFDFETTVRTYP